MNKINESLIMEKMVKYQEDTIGSNSADRLLWACLYKIDLRLKAVEEGLSKLLKQKE